MYWFPNQFSNLTRSILFPGGGASSSDNYSSFNPNARPDYHSRMPDSPYSGGAARGPRSPGDSGSEDAARAQDRAAYDAARRNWERDRYQRGGFEEDSSRFANPATAPQNTPRPNRPAEPPRPNLPPLLSGPLRLPPVFRPTETPRLPGAPTLHSLPSLPSLPSLNNPFRRPLP